MAKERGVMAIEQASSYAGISRAAAMGWGPMWGAAPDGYPGGQPNYDAMRRRTGVMPKLQACAPFDNTSGTRRGFDALAVDPSHPQVTADKDHVQVHDGGDYS